MEGNIGLLGKLASVERNKDKERKIHKKLKSINSLNPDEKTSIRGMVGKLFDKH